MDNTARLAVEIAEFFVEEKLGRDVWVETPELGWTYNAEAQELFDYYFDVLLNDFLKLTITKNLPL